MVELVNGWAIHSDDSMERPGFRHRHHGRVCRCRTSCFIQFVFFFPFSPKWLCAAYCPFVVGCLMHLLPVCKFIFCHHYGDSVFPENYRGSPILAQYSWYSVSDILNLLSEGTEKNQYDIWIPRATNDFTIRRVHWLLKRIRYIQIFTVLYNQAFCYVHFAWKISGFVTCITCTTSGILLIHTISHQATMYFICGIQAAVVYCTLFHKTFSIPMLMTKLKKKVEQRTKDNTFFGGPENVVLLKSIHAIRSISITVGHFHKFERMSTPNFLGFAAKNIARIVIVARNGK